MKRYTTIKKVSSPSGEEYRIVEYYYGDMGNISLLIEKAVPGLSIWEKEEEKKGEGWRKWEEEMNIGNIDQWKVEKLASWLRGTIPLGAEI